MSTCRPAARAVAAFDISSASARITEGRRTCPNGAVRESARRSSTARSAWVGLRPLAKLDNGATRLR